MWVSCWTASSGTHIELCYFFVVHAVGIKCSIYGAFARTIRALGLLQSQVVYNVHA